jgi:hypothetical protein
MFVYTTTDCYHGGYFFAAGVYLEIPAEWYAPASMTRTGVLPPANSPLGIQNPRTLIPWSVINPAGLPLDRAE